MFKIKSYFEIEEKSKFLRKNKKNYKIFFSEIIMQNNKALCNFVHTCVQDGLHT